MDLNVQNRRKQQRHEFPDAVTICPEGISQVIDISSGGISLRCRCEQCLTERWLVDIVDSKRTDVLDFPVEKVWESAGDQKRYPSIFSTRVGVKFKRLSPKQQSALFQLIYS